MEWETPMANKPIKKAKIFRFSNIQRMKIAM